MTAERAVAIERVSTRRQTPGLQSPEIAARIRERGYVLAREPFTLSVSARKGKQQAVLDAILDGARRGEWSVVLCVAIDRIERRGVFVLTDWISDLRRADARVESTSPGEEWLSDTSDELVWSIRLNMEADRAKREAELRAERTMRGHAYLDTLQKGRIKLPLGWRYEAQFTPGGKRVKFTGEIVTDEAAMEVVRAAFALAASGGTLQAIARDMTARGYKRTPEAIGQLLRMECYATGQLYVPVPVEVEQAVSPEVQAAAIAALEARRTVTGPRNRNVDADSFAGRIFCKAHHAPLHTMTGPKRKDGSKVRYYRARVNGMECGCGLFNADAVDAAMNSVMMLDTEPETEIAVTGDSSVRLAQIEQQMTRVFRKKPAGWTATLAELEAEQTHLKSGNTSGWERRETGRMMRDVWKSLNRAEQRRYLERQTETMNYRVVAEKSGGNIWISLDREF